MKVAIIADCLREEILTGIQRYASMLASGLTNRGVNTTLLFKDIPNNFKSSVFKLKAYGIINFPIWNRLTRDKFINYHANKYDILHDPTNYSMPLRRINCKKVLTIHDVGPLRYPEYFPRWTVEGFKTKLPKILKYIDAVITVSNFQRNEFLNYYPLTPEKVFTVYSCINLNIFNKKAISQVNKDKYILFVGTFQPRKGIITLIRAFNKIKNKISHKLYLIGQKGRNYEEIYSEINKLDLHNKIHMLGSVPISELVNYYSNASLTVFPSLYEGFGFVPLEAMACECPVITSNTTSLGELYSNVCLTVDPTDVEQLSEKILLILNNENLRIKMIKNGIEYVKIFSIENFINNTINVYNKILNY